MTEKHSDRTIPPEQWDADRPRYSFKGLREIRRSHLKENRKAFYKELLDKGKLEEHLDRSAEDCIKEQKYIVANGIAHDSQAWSWAVRSSLLDSEWD